MKRIKIIALLSFLLLSVCQQPANAQRQPKERSIEQLPRIPVDTIPTEQEGTSIILYSNNTWKYFHKDVGELATYKGYNDHWDTTQVFAYKDFDYSIQPSFVELNLVGSLAEFHSPVVGKVLSRYGRRGRSNHNGVDIPLKTGEPIYATFDGKVRYARYNTGGYGYMVILRHPNGLESWHGHLSKLNVRTNEYVKAGQIIGFAGNTGRSYGSHLHYELRYQDQTFDPEFLIDFENGMLRYQVFALEKSFLNIHSHASEILEDAEDDYLAMGSLLAEADDSTAIRAAMGKVPKEEPVLSQSNAVYHTIQKGDMLGKLAIRYGVSIDQICRLNGITRNTILQLNKRLRIK